MKLSQGEDFYEKFRIAFWLILAFLALTSCGKKPSSESPSVTTSTDTTEPETITSAGDSGSEATTFTITWKIHYMIKNQSCNRIIFFYLD